MVCFKNSIEVRYAGSGVARGASGSK